MQAGVASDRIQDTVHQIFTNKELLGGLERAVITTIKQIQQSGRPTYLPGYVGSNMHYEFTHNAPRELKKYSFEWNKQWGQLRVISSDLWGYRISMAGATGRVHDEFAMFRWPKGPVTVQSVRANQWLYGASVTNPLQYSLFDSLNSDVTVAGVDPREIFMFVLWDIAPKSISSWLTLGSEFRDQKTMFCKEVAQICDEPLDLELVADIVARDDDSDYEIPFAELG